MKTYHATYTREGPYRVVQFQEPDISTFGRTLAAARDHARDALATYLEVPALDAIEAQLAETVEVPGVDRPVRDRGLSTRDIGDVLGISHGRVAQLSASATPDGETAAVHRRAARRKRQTAPA